jgi:hypothetical protein
MPSEYVMRGNAAILKCSIPSFVADFVHVVAWVDEDETEIVATEDFTSSKVESAHAPFPKPSKMFPSFMSSSFKF